MDWFTLLLIFIFFVLPLIQQIAEARKRGGQPPVDAPEEEWDWEAEQREAQRSGTAEAQREQVSGNGGWSEGWGSWPGDPPPEPVAEERPVDRAERVTVPRREPDTVSERPSGERNALCRSRPFRSGSSARYRRFDRSACSSSARSRWSRCTWSGGRLAGRVSAAPSPARRREQCVPFPRWRRCCTTATSCGVRWCFPKSSDLRGRCGSWKARGSERFSASDCTDGRGGLSRPFFRVLIVQRADHRSRRHET
jgi:hypothetical protein